MNSESMLSNLTAYSVIPALEFFVAVLIFGMILLGICYVLERVRDAADKRHNNR